MTDNRSFRKKSGAKKKVDEYAQDEKKKISYADVVNSTHVAIWKSRYRHLDISIGIGIGISIGIAKISFLLY